MNDVEARTLIAGPAESLATFLAVVECGLQAQVPCSKVSISYPLVWSPLCGLGCWVESLYGRSEEQDTTPQKTKETGIRNKLFKACKALDKGCAACPSAMESKKVFSDRRRKVVTTQDRQLRLSSFECIYMGRRFECCSAVHCVLGPPERLPTKVWASLPALENRYKGVGGTLPHIGV